MNTENLNISPNDGGNRETSNKAFKAKKVAGESAKFAGAAALGVAGTMAAQAMTDDNVNEEDIITEVGTPEDSNENPEEVEEVVETTEEFNPNEIRLDESTVHQASAGAQASEIHEQDLVEIDVPEPQTLENGLAMVDPDDPEQLLVEVGPEPTIGSEEEVEPFNPEETVLEYGGPDGWDQLDDPENNDPNDIDIVDDLMA